MPKVSDLIQNYSSNISSDNNKISSPINRSNSKYHPQSDNFIPQTLLQRTRSASYTQRNNFPIEKKKPWNDIEHFQKSKLPLHSNNQSVGVSVDSSGCPFSGLASSSNSYISMETDSRIQFLKQINDEFQEEVVKNKHFESNPEKFRDNTFHRTTNAHLSPRAIPVRKSSKPKKEQDTKNETFFYDLPSPNIGIPNSKRSFGIVNGDTRSSCSYTKKMRNKDREAKVIRKKEKLITRTNQNQKFFISLPHVLVEKSLNNPENLVEEQKSTNVNDESSLSQAKSTQNTKEKSRNWDEGFFSWPYFLNLNRQDKNRKKFNKPQQNLSENKNIMSSTVFPRYSSPSCVLSSPSSIHESHGSNDSFQDLHSPRSSGDCDITLHGFSHNQTHSKSRRVREARHEEYRQNLPPIHAINENINCPLISDNQKEYSDDVAEPRTESENKEGFRLDPPPSTCELHDIISSASSPTDLRWKTALSILAHSSNPYANVSYRVTDAHNWNALHVTCLSNPPLYFLQALLFIYREGVSTLDAGELSPLHLAAGSGASISVLSCLIKCEPNSVRWKNKRGMMPLHLALQRHCEDTFKGECNEFTVELLRLLLGQTCKNEMQKMKIGKKIKDGGMRKGEHLNLGVNDISDGIFNQRFSSTCFSEKRRADTVPPISRGFVRSYHSLSEADKEYANPFHSSLQDLWSEEKQSPHTPRSSLTNFPPSSDPVKFHDEKELLINEAERHGRDVVSSIKLLIQKKKSHMKKNMQSKIPVVINNDKLNYEDKEKITFKESPAAVSVPPHNRLPLHMAIRRNHSLVSSNLSPIHARSLLLPRTNHNDFLRVLVHANPAALYHRDVEGYTPLLTCLHLSNLPAAHPIDMEVVELLLGIRSGGYKLTPIWFNDSDLLSFSSSHQHQDLSTIYNPAMVGMDDNTFPLHVAAGVSLPAPIIRVVFSCHPGARYIQDGRKRTPFHRALQDRLPDPEVVHILLDEKVATMKDDLGRTPLDLLVMALRGKNNSTPSRRWQYVYRPIFHDSTLAGEDLSQCEDGSILLSKLYPLPHWLQRQACAVPLVRHLLIKRLTGTIGTAIILLYGAILLLLVCGFVCLADDYVRDRVTSHWVGSYSIIVLVAAMILLLKEAGLLLVAFRLGTMSRQYLRNFWTWVNIIGTLLSFKVTFLMLDKDSSASIALITTTVGLLWCMVIGYLAQWWYAVGACCSGLIRMIQHLVPSSLVFSLFTWGFLQMIYLLLAPKSSYLFCDDNNIMDIDVNDHQICTIWNSYLYVYDMIIGKGITEESLGTIVVSIVYIIILSLFIIHIIILTVSIGFQVDETLMLDQYWTPLVTFIFCTELIQDWKFCFDIITPCWKNDDKIYHICESLRKKSAIRSHGFIYSWENRMGNIWNFFCTSLTFRDVSDTKWWYLKSDKKYGHCFSINLWIIRLLGLLILPLWCVTGLISFGVMWPPQVRWCLFYLSCLGYWNKYNDYKCLIGRDFVVNKSLITDLEKNDRMTLQEDISKVKMMIHERFLDIQRNIWEIRDKM